MVELDNMDIMAVLSDATNSIAEGEVMQLANVGNEALSEADYLEVIRCKTAMLFQAAAHTAGVLGSEDADRSARSRSSVCISAWPISSWTTIWTTPVTARSWARTRATTSQRAS